MSDENKQLEEARKNVRVMEKSGQTKTIHHEILAKLEGKPSEPKNKEKVNG